MYGTQWEPNTFASMLTAIVLIGATLFVSNEFAAWRKALGIALLVMILALALNASRASLGILALGLIFVVLFAQGMALREKIKWALVAAGIVLIVSVSSLEVSRVLMRMPSAPNLASRAPCAAWIAAGMPTSMLSNNPDDFPGMDAETDGAAAMKRLLEGQTLASRWVVYLRAWNEFVQRPFFGNGVDSFGQHFTTTAHTPGWISNMFLMSLHDTGIVGTILLIAWFIWYAYFVFDAWRRAQVSAMRTMVFALGIGVVGLLIAYQATTMLWFGWVWFLFAILAKGAKVMATRDV
jgi:O-antigen ligase